MKYISLLVVAVLLSFSAKAQNEMDAYRFSKNDLTGTARSVSMGGAFGALGGDISGVAINPAGIGIYKNSEIVTTLNFQNAKAESNFAGNKLDESKFKFYFDNLAFVTTFPLNSDVAPYLNFGFSYNKLKGFDRKYRMDGENTYALADYMADRATGAGVKGSWINLGTANEDDMWDIWNVEDWLAVLGYNGGAIEDKGDNGNYDPTIAYRPNNDLFVEEKGSISSYDFNLGTTFSDMVSVGLTLSLTDINYRLYSSLIEESGPLGYELQNWSRTDGTGWQIKTGVIFKPIHELRIGVAYHSPTWYNMTDHFAADLGYENTIKGSGIVRSYDGREDAVFDYELRTPDKWTLSLAGVIGNKAIISADYELTDYSKMKLFDRNGRSLEYGQGDPNGFIKEDFKLASTLRLGLEYRFTNQFSGRVGYSWMQSPIESKLKDNQGFNAIENGTMAEVTTDNRPVTQYILDGDTHFITYGLGYRISRNFYTDIAFIMKSQKDDLYSHTGAEKAELKTNTFQGLLTLGYKF